MGGQTPRLVEMNAPTGKDAINQGKPMQDPPGERPLPLIFAFDNCMNPLIKVHANDLFNIKSVFDHGHGFVHGALIGIEYFQCLCPHILPELCIL